MLWPAHLQQAYPLLLQTWKCNQGFVAIPQVPSATTLLHLFQPSGRRANSCLASAVMLYDWLTACIVFTQAGMWWLLCPVVPCWGLNLWRPIEMTHLLSVLPIMALENQLLPQRLSQCTQKDQVSTFLSQSLKNLSFFSAWFSLHYFVLLISFFRFTHNLLVEKSRKPPIVQSRPSSGGIATRPFQMRMSASVYIYRSRDTVHLKTFSSSFLIGFANKQYTYI